MRHSILLALALASILPGESGAPINPKQIVRESIKNYERDWRAQKSWSWIQTDTTTSDDTKEVDVSQVIPLQGTPFERLIKKDGRPLTPEEQRKENRKYQKALKERARETPAERAARIRKYDNERAFVRDIPEAYDFRLLGEEPVKGRPAWMFEMTPRPGFVPTAPHGNILEHIKGKLWIDKQDVQWAKAEADVIDTISIGWILARIGAGAHFFVEQTRVANGLWMPTKLTITGVAHVLLVHSKNLNEELTYSGYHEADSTSAER